jgi:hypothetical protein
MGMPYTVFTCFAFHMYREVKKARARDAAAQQAAGAASDSAELDANTPSLATLAPSLETSEPRELAQV